jgi:hypothetical protein
MGYFPPLPDIVYESQVADMECNDLPDLGGAEVNHVVSLM